MNKILINGLLLNRQFTGVQYYAENLIKALGSLNCKDCHFEIILPGSYNGGLINTENLEIKKQEFNNGSRVKRIAFENFKLSQYYKQNNCQLFHSPSYVLPYYWDFPSVLTVHDIIALDFPEMCQDESAFYFKLFLPRSIKNATRIIAVSNKVKNDIINRFNVPSEKIEVVYHGIADHYSLDVTDEELYKIKKRYNLPEKYILFVGNIEPKKNLERLVQAFHILKRNTEITHKLVIVGKKGWKYGGLIDIIQKLQIAKEILFTGYVPDKHLQGIYKMASIFAFPSLYEGFGIPPLEAMACGTPVMISDRGALPEIASGNALIVNPLCADQMAGSMYKLITDKSLRQKLTANGMEWVTKFTWENAAIKTLEVYREAIKLSNLN